MQQIVAYFCRATCNQLATNTKTNIILQHHLVKSDLVIYFLKTCKKKVFEYFNMNNTELPNQKH